MISQQIPIVATKYMEKSQNWGTFDPSGSVAKELEKGNK